ncbi:hypothetical protein [Stenotrophomonas maltophilia]|uniref:hypothetical protein n=1 Tax=Stenotrophomonas maltophilia TaxID=40324 RepID=UPI0039C1E8B3
MAKQKNTSAQAASGPADTREAPAAVVDAAAGQGEQTDAESPGADAAAVVGEPETDEGGDSQRPETVEADNDLPRPDEEPAPPEGERVPVLVLSNNHLGKVGQVIQVNAAHVEALRLGGLIDPHPNAIKSATPEE